MPEGQRPGRCGSSGSSVRELPHSPQSLNPGGFSAPHRGHVVPSFGPHLPQNFMPGGLSDSQRRHLMARLLYAFRRQISSPPAELPKPCASEARSKNERWAAGKGEAP